MVDRSAPMSEMGYNLLADNQTEMGYTDQNIDAEGMITTNTQGRQGSIIKGSVAFKKDQLFVL